MDKEKEQKEEQEKEKEEKEEKEKEKEEGKKEGKKEKEEMEKKDEEIPVVIGDTEGGIHQIPLLVAASMTEIWKQVPHPPSSAIIQTPMTKEILMHVLLYQRCCVVHHVKVLEEISNARELLESKVNEDPAFAQGMKDAAEAIASESLALFLECCSNLASFETLPEVESEDRTNAFSRQAERVQAKKPIFTTFGELSTEEEKIANTISLGQVTWVGANGPEKEADLSFSWLNPKKEDPPSQIQANKIIGDELHESAAVVQHLEEVL